LDGGGERGSGWTEEGGMGGSGWTEEGSVESGGWEGEVVGRRRRRVAGTNTRYNNINTPTCCYVLTHTK